MSVNNNDMLDRILVYNMYNNGDSKTTIARKCSSKSWKKYGFKKQRSRSFVARWSTEEINTNVCYTFVHMHK